MTLPAFTPTRVVHVNRDHHYDVYIGRAVDYRRDLRPLAWGNPYHKWNTQPPQTPLGRYAHDLARTLENNIVFRVEFTLLQGKKLACWCAKTKEGLPADLVNPVCHGQIMAAILDLRALYVRGYSFWDTVETGEVLHAQPS